MGIPVDAPATGIGSVEEALDGLGNLDAADITVTGGDGGPYTITFAGAVAGIDVELSFDAATSLTNDGNEDVSVTQEGGSTSVTAIVSERNGQSVSANISTTTDGILSIDEALEDLVNIGADNIVVSETVLDA